MTRRRRGDDSSLELLLDTICNTFGGVLFVAILIVVMLRMTSKAEVEGDERQVSEAEQAELEQQQSEVVSALETLRRAAEELDETALAADDKTTSLLDELKRQRTNRQALVETRLSVLDATAQRQIHVNQLTRELTDLDRREQAVRRSINDLEAALKAEKAARSQKVEYSQIRQTSKQEIGIVLRYGRFYVWHKYGAAGQRLGLNTEDFVVLEETPALMRATPLPTGGAIIADTPEATRQLLSRIGKFNPQQFYFCLVVWNDSFDQFAILKKLLVNAGFQYRILPAKAGSNIYDRGGGGEGVQ